MFVYVAVFAGPFLERSNQFSVPDFNEDILLDFGFVAGGSNRYILRVGNAKIIIWVVDYYWYWSISGVVDMNYIINWVENAISQYKNVSPKRGPSSWVDYVG